MTHDLHDYQDQAVFFDAQAGAPWAAAPYGADEAPKLERFFARTGSLNGCSVLEPGCGTGRLTEVLARAVGGSGRVLACDVSPRMVNVAQNRVSNMPQVEVRNAPLDHLDLGEGTMDAVVCHQVFPHFSDKPGALRILARVLRPGGSLLIMHFEERAVINDVHRKAGTVVEHHMLPDLDTMDRLLGAAGFKRVFHADDKALGYLLHAVR